ncbi:beta-microseminoprotein-like [Lithobates pipiens]
MKYLVAAILCVGFILSVCDAFCMNQPPPMLKYGQKHLRGCVFEGKLHKLGSKWITENCMDCSCRSDGSVGCCSKLGLPMEFDRNRCEYIEDKKTCTWRVVSKEDPTKDCY